MIDKHQIYRRGLECFFSLLLLVLLAPLFLVIAAAIRLDSPGPVFFRQARVGLGGVTFQIFKFRTMVVDAEKLGSYQTKKNDSRVTTIGRLLRRSSLDELPQLVNIVLGDMAFVGPRPYAPPQQALYSERDWQIRHSVKPGLTGLAQVRLRSTGCLSDKLAMDLTYVRDQSLMLDAKILLMTIPAVLNVSKSN